MNERWGIDLGGTKIEGVVLDADSNDCIARVRIPTEADQGFEHIVERLADLVNRISSESKLPLPSSIGLGTPGVTDPDTGLMKNANTTCLNGRPLAKAVRERIGCDIRLANDANCFALAEATLGAAKGFATVFGVILGTGVGGGVVINGAVISGRHGIAGEWGHNVLDPEGAPCYCGKRGCVETVISGPALERWYEQRSGEGRRLPEIASRAEACVDFIATETIDRLVDSFARAISVVVNILDPHAIVIGGGVGNIEALYERASDALSREIFNPKFSGAILRPTLGDSAGVFGAAMLNL